MQTFLIDPDYYVSARILHSKHLGNQYYREGMILLTGGWSKHPASKMWKGYEYSLTSYLLACQCELQRRGKWYGKTAVLLRHIRRKLKDTGFPKWLGNKDFHDSHKSNLLRKDKEKGWNWYKHFNWNVPDSLAYVWPEGE